VKGYYWQGPSGWFWRENPRAEDWHGPFSSRAKAKEARAEFYDKIFKNTMVVTV